MKYSHVNWTALCMILLAVVAFVQSFAAGSPAIGGWVGLALVFTATGLWQVAAILRQQQERITRLEQFARPS
jgi:hypothetical protein